MVQYIQDVINFLQGQQWAAFIAVIGSGLAVSVAVEFLKKLPNLERQAVIHFLVVALTVAATALQAIYISGPKSLSLFGVYGAAIWSFSQIAYNLAVKPLSSFAGRLQVSVNSPASLANAIDNPTTMTSLPGETTPQSTSSSNVADF